MLYSRTIGCYVAQHINFMKFQRKNGKNTRRSQLFHHFNEIFIKVSLLLEDNVILFNG